MNVLQYLVSGYSVKQNGMRILKGIRIAIKTLALDLDGLESSKKQPE